MCVRSGGGVCRWAARRPGGEYGQTLEIQNRLPHSQVIEYSLPENKSTFFLEFPAPVTLAPGMARGGRGLRYTVTVV